jgi:uncharacterized iron-regulated membrane protein
MARRIFFWFHFVLGVIAAAPIAVMSFTGAALAFEKELVAWAEREARRVAAAPGTPRLPLETLVARVQAARPDARIASFAVSADAGDAVAFGLPGNVFLYADPYSGTVREGRAPRMRAFIATMRAWHLRLGFSPGPGNPGYRINSAANFAFVFICLSGLVLWWPRAWQARALRPALTWMRGTRGRARDWNWHNATGFWSLPILLILAGTGVVISYRWAGDLVFHLAGETPPAQGAPRAGAAAAPVRPRPAPGPLPSPDALLQKVAADFPGWELITLRFTPPLRALPAAAEGVTAVVRTDRQWPVFAATTLTLDPQTGTVRRTETFADLTPGQRARRWIRLLHSGEAYGWPSQLVAGLACLGGCVLVWTGLALAWRRWFGKAEHAEPSA